MVQNAYPVYCTLANLSLEEQEKDENKIVIAFFPMTDKAELDWVPNQLKGFFSTILWHRFMGILLKPLKLQRDGNI